MKRQFIKFILGLVSFSSTHRKTCITIKGVIIGIPPAILGYAKLSLDPSNPLPFQESICDFFKVHFVILCIVIAWPFIASIILSIISDWLDNISKVNKANEFELFTLLKALDRVLGKKLDRFGKYAKSIKETTAKSTVFANITHPQKQIETLIDNLFNTLATITGDTSIEVVLAKIENSEPVSWEYYMPEDSHPPDDLLDSQKRGNTLFAHAAQKRHKPEVVEDIEKHLNRTQNKGKRKYVPLDEATQGVDDGSIACFPLYHEHLRDVVYCISVKSGIPGRINNKYVKRYGYIVEEFAKRILLEHTLQYMKEVAK
jgi:hypothetical protein